MYLYSKYCANKLLLAFSTFAIPYTVCSKAFGRKITFFGGHQQHEGKKNTTQNSIIRRKCFNITHGNRTVHYERSQK